MKLSCPSCGAKYSIADEKVHDRLAKIRCRKCSATIIIDGKVSPPNVYTSDPGGSHPNEADEGAAGGPVPGQYSVDFGDNDQRSMSADDIVQAYRRGELTRETYVWAEGMGDWTAIGEIPELSGILDSAGAAAQPAPRAAARSGSGRGSAHDLFGGIETAGSEADVTTSAPQPAAPQVATGARNESSVLFSLSALTASAGAPASPSAPTKTSTSMVDNKVDDSGLIDLKALTSSVANQAPMGVGPLGLGTAPLGMAAPLGGMTAPAISIDDHMPRQQGGKTGMYIAGALVVVGALIAAAIVFTSSKEAPAAAASAVTTPVVTAAPAAAPEPKKEELAAPPATGTAEAAAAPSSAAVAKNTSTGSKSTGSKSSGGKKPSSGGGVEKTSAPTPPTASEPAEKPKPKPKPNACNCSAGDLMCAMKCAAGH